MDVVADQKTTSLTAEITGSADASNFSWYVKDNCLYIKLKKSIRENPTATIKLTTPNLEKLTVISSTVRLSGFDVHMFDLDVSSKGYAVLDIDCYDMTAKVSGNSVVTLSGSANYFTLSSSTNSKTDAYKFKAKSVNVSLTSLAEASVYASDRLVANTNLDSFVRYMGEPMVKRFKTATKGAIIKVD